MKGIPAPATLSINPENSAMHTASPSQMGSPDQWAVLGASAVTCGCLAGLCARVALKQSASPRVAMPLAIAGGLRLFLLGTLMVAVVGTSVFTAGGYAMYDEHGELSWFFHLREFTLYSFCAGILLIPIELVYMGIARAMSHRGVGATGFMLIGLFALLGAWLLAEVGMFVPMV